MPAAVSAAAYAAQVADSIICLARSAFSANPPTPRRSSQKALISIDSVNSSSAFAATTAVASAGSR